MWRFCSACRSFAPSAWMACPISTYSPDQALSWRPRMCRSVDLPAPDGPMIDTNSPGLMSSVIRRSTYDWPLPTGYDFSTPRSDIRGVLGSGWDTSVTGEADDPRLNNMF